MRTPLLCACVVIGQICAQSQPMGQGGAPIEWVSPSTFRYVRSWGAPPRRRGPIKHEAVSVTIQEMGPRVRFKTRYLTLDAERDGSRLEITMTGGAHAVISIRREEHASIVETSVTPGERFYGLGSRNAANLDLRGLVIRNARGVLISSAGYGEYFPDCAACAFDLAASHADRRSTTVPGDGLEFFFYYGPRPKEILEEHLAVGPRPTEIGAEDLAIRPPEGTGTGTWVQLRNAVRSLAHQSMSGVGADEFDLSPYQRAGGALASRAMQLATYLPLVYATASGDAAYRAMLKRRARLVPYLVAYAYELRSRGVPVVRPLAMQFPRDEASARRTDELMVGDELLVVPVVRPGDSVRVYLPPGIWTDLRTNRTYTGRQEVSMPTIDGGIPVFGRNGTILPLAPETPGGPIELHYFPKLAAEFFLYEEDLEEFSQVHAAPVGDAMRLESESAIARTYEWIVHHTPRPRRVVKGTAEFENPGEPGLLTPGRWYYDTALENLHVRVRARAGGDEIVNIFY
jgi:alpha-glucosidase (family GH31 glycosyl hydrolase)